MSTHSASRLKGPHVVQVYDILSTRYVVMSEGGNGQCRIGILVL